MKEQPLQQLCIPFVLHWHCIFSSRIRIEIMPLPEDHARIDDKPLGALPAEISSEMRAPASSPGTEPGGSGVVYAGSPYSKLSWVF